MTPTPADIARILHIRDQAHVWHWQTRGLGVHAALGSLYAAWLDKADEFVETVSRAERFPMACIVPALVNYTSPDSVVAFVTDAESWVKTDLATRVEPEEIGIANLVADMANILAHHVYMLSLG